MRQMQSLQFSTTVFWASVDQIPQNISTTYPLLLHLPPPPPPHHLPPQQVFPAQGQLRASSQDWEARLPRSCKFIREFIKALSVSERWLAFKCLKADRTINRRANLEVALTWNYRQPIQFITTERLQDANYREINSNTIHKSFTFPSFLCSKMPCWGWRFWYSVKELAGVWIYKAVKRDQSRCWHCSRRVEHHSCGAGASFIQQKFFLALIHCTFWWLGSDKCVQVKRICLLAV